MVQTIELDIAEQIVAAAKEEAEAIDVPMVIAVTDAAGNLISLERMDGGKIVSISVAQNKAYTAAAVQKPSHELKEAAEPGGDVYGLPTSDDGRIVVFGGGFPIRKDDEIVGAIGVSGGAVSEDMQVARAGIEAVEGLSE